MTMYTDDQLDSTLRSLDPADRHIDPLRGRAADDLEAILATSASASASPSTATGSALTATRRRPVRRIAVAGAAAAAMALGIVAIPALTADNDDGAFASWAAVPEPLAAEQRPGAADECRNSYRDGPGDYSADLDSAGVAVAEKRGAWVTVVLSGDDGFTATCISDDSAGLFSSGMIGTIGALPEMAAGPRTLEPTSLGVAMVDNEELSMIAGYSGGDVTGVRYSSETHGDVVATVAEERFALWMPGDELRDAHSDGVEVEVTYADGTMENVRLSY